MNAIDFWSVLSVAGMVAWAVKMPLPGRRWLTLIGQKESRTTMASGGAAEYVPK